LKGQAFGGCAGDWADEGTSLDGVDVALIETGGVRVTRFGPTGYRPYAEAERDLMRQALVQGAGLTNRISRPGVLAEADALVTSVHRETVETFIARQQSRPGRHRRRRVPRVQIGNGAALAKRLKLPVAYDFRLADIEAGGQGAPMVPVFHQALARSLYRPYPVAVLNIGGVANVTFVAGGDPIACDTGPGNALINDFMRARAGAPYDNFGDVADCPRERGNGRRSQPVGRCAGGAGLRLSGGAHTRRPADHISDDDRRAQADDGRRHRAALDALAVVEMVAVQAPHTVSAGLCAVALF
jgi:1,6-anhydro-N-acetylmuramate kinase